MLKVASLHADIGGSRILRGVSLEVGPGEVACLMGRNGVGKTTTLKSITGLREVRSGTISLEGKPLNGLPPDARARLGIGYVPQGRDIFPHMTVEENLRIGYIANGSRITDVKASLERIYSLFPVLKSMLARKGGVLSGGQQQQLAIGRALLTGPKLLILDEPTEGIQPSIIEEIGETIKLLRTSEKLAILLVEQYVDFCRDVGDRYFAMDRGTVVSSGLICDLTDEVVKTHLQV